MFGCLNLEGHSFREPPINTSKGHKGIVWIDLNSFFLLLCLSVDFNSNKSSVSSRVFYGGLNDRCIPDCIFANEVDSDALNTAVASKRKRIRFEKITSEQRFFVFSLPVELLLHTRFHPSISNIQFYIYFILFYLFNFNFILILFYLFIFNFIIYFILSYFFIYVKNVESNLLGGKGSKICFKLLKEFTDNREATREFGNTLRINFFYSSIIQYSEWILRTAALATPLNSKLEGGKEGVRISSVT